MRKLIATIGLVILTTSTRAALSPVGIGILPPLQFPSSEVTIAGLRVGALWGHHRIVYGIDVGGVGTITDQYFGGILQLGGIFNANGGELGVFGAQVAGIYNRNINKAHVIGVQLAGAVNHNQAESRTVGLQIAALANIAPATTIVGAQIGLYNRARKVYGFQIGLINVADELHGLQIGLLNTHKQGLFYTCPVLNFGF